MSHLTLLLLVDALRADYVHRTRYLKHLVADSATGVLRECFGFVPRAAYFGGLDAAQYGFTNMYCFDPDSSPFRMARALPASDMGRVVEGAFGLREFVESYAHRHLPSFASNYLTSIDIPLPFLPYFAPVEIRAPWDPKVGYRSLFAILDEQGLPWVQCSWPESNQLPDHSDRGLVSHLLTELRPEHRFAYLHLQELDCVGHLHGPGSNQVQKTLTDTDALIKALMASLGDRYDALDVLLFGDHGMVDVVSTIDIWSFLKKLPLRFGDDYAFFLDSTMARFWFFTAAARRITTEALSGVHGGHWLDANEMHRFGIASCDRRNGEAFFLADPGVIVAPNFFQRSPQEVSLKGMHGYDLDCLDNLGFFLLHTAGGIGAELPGRETTARGDLGLVDPHDLFPTILDLIGLPEHIPAHRQSLSSRVRQKVAPTFTQHPDPAAEQVICDQLKRVERAVHERVEGATIVVSGSFGRGEGGVFRGADGHYQPVNDYDIFVVGNQIPQSVLDDVAHDLAPSLGTDYFDLVATDGNWSELPLTILNFDLKYGSRVLSGDAGVLDRIPQYAPADIPIFELVRLLLNRTGGLISGLKTAFLSGGTASLDERRYLTNQVVKAFLAVGDWHVASRGGYDASYAKRGQRFAQYAQALRLESGLVARVSQAFRLKLEPNYASGLDGVAAVREAASAINTCLFDAVGKLCDKKMAEGKEGAALDDVMASFTRFVDADVQWVMRDNAFWAAHPKISRVLRAPLPERQSVRNSVMSSLPLLLQAALSLREAATYWRLVRSRLTACFVLPEDDGMLTPERFEVLRQQMVSWWLTLVH